MRDGTCPAASGFAIPLACHSLGFVPTGAGYTWDISPRSLSTFAFHVYSSSIQLAAPFYFG
jgi:hypothetical protein